LYQKQRRHLVTSALSTWSRVNEIVGSTANGDHKTTVRGNICKAKKTLMCHVIALFETEVTNLTFTGPCIVIYSYNKSQQDSLFINFILVKNSTFFRTNLLSIITSLNTFTAIVDLSRFNNSCLKSLASTLVDLTFQSRALRSFSLNQLRNLSL